MKKFSALLLLLSPLLSTAQSDGWTNGKGKGVAAFSAGYEFGLDYSAGTTAIGLQRSIASAALFGSYGIADNLDIGVQVPFVSIKNTAALQDGAAFIKYMFSKSDKLSLGLLMSGSTPLSNYSTDNGIATIGQQAQVVGGALIAQYTLQSNLFLGAAVQLNAKSPPVPNDVFASIWLAKTKGKVFSQIAIDLRNAIGGKDYRGIGDLRPDSFQEIGASSIRLNVKQYRQLGDRSGFAVAVSGQVPLRNADLSVGLFVSYVMKFGKR